MLICYPILIPSKQRLSAPPAVPASCYHASPGPLILFDRSKKPQIVNCDAWSNEPFSPFVPFFGSKIAHHKKRKREAMIKRQKRSREHMEEVSYIWVCCF
jgi:hypothetical protein